ncbi:MAG: hemerythrin domain-containing protein [Sphingomonadales bacterium]|nr:hemerythrin domain-containing protein [Sphingomonadales bacterium]
MAKATKSGKKSEAKTKKSSAAKAEASAPKIKAPIGSTPSTKFRGDPAIFGRLVEDHDRHRALLAMISQTEGASPDRASLFVEFCREVKGHAAAEEQALWSTVLRKPETTEFARHAVAEHHELDEMMADLAARDQATAAWKTRFEAMKEQYLHHIKEEEQEQFVESEKHLSDADQRFMHKVFNRRKKAEKAAAKLEKKLSIAPPA